MFKYALKINTDFTEEEIIKNTKVFNYNQPEEYLINENNFNANNNLNNFLSHTIINLNVEGARVKFIGRYKTEHSLCDVSCVVNHNANHTKSQIDIKGIVDNGGKLISRSNILVKENLKDIIGSENTKFIFIMNDNNKMGELDTIPSLDIQSNEISINHTLSISKINELDIFYHELHGLDKKEANENIIFNFLKI